MKRAKLHITRSALKAIFSVPDSVELMDIQRSPEDDCYDMYLLGEGLSDDCVVREAEVPLTIAGFEEKPNPDISWPKYGTISEGYNPDST